jgi:malate dehydrogenase (oxaloacetate-decarboxylating)
VHRRHGPDAIVAFVKAAAPTFGGINLEDISAPACFEIERRLRAELDIPVFHDDQHGTAVVVLAALVNALRVVGKAAEDVRVVVVGAGAAGLACTDIVLAHGVGDIVVCDRDGRAVPRRPAARRRARALAERTNRDNVRGQRGRGAARRGRPHRRLGPGRGERGGDPDHGRRPHRLRHGQPHPGGPPGGRARRRGDHRHGRSDYPNQINNVLAFPGSSGARSTCGRRRSTSR